MNNEKKAQETENANDVNALEFTIKLQKNTNNIHSQQKVRFVYTSSKYI